MASPVRVATRGGELTIAWSGVGIVASVLISWFLFGEKLNGWGIFAVAMIIIGCIILNVFGTDH